MLSRREAIIKQLVANDLQELLEAINSHSYDELVAILTNGFRGYANMSEDELESIWLAEGFGHLI